MAFQRFANVRISKISPDSGKFKRIASKHIADLSPNFCYVEVDGLHWSTDDSPRPNDNGDAFHKEELLRKRSDGQYVYQTWNKKGVFKQHHSDDVGGENHIGLILDTYPHFIECSIKMLTALDRDKDKELVRRVEAGRHTDVSMGCTVEKAVCSACGNVARNMSEVCLHVSRYKGKTNPSTGDKVFEWNYGVTGNELSFVTVGADKDAKVRNILAGDFNIDLVKVGNLLESHHNRLASEIGNSFLRIASKKEVTSEDIAYVNSVSCILEKFLE